MKHNQIFSLFAVGLPFMLCFYGKSQALYTSGIGGEELFNADTFNTYAPLSGNIDDSAKGQACNADTENLSLLRAQQYKTHSNPAYQNLLNSDAISETLQQRNAMHNIREGNINLVPSNLVHKVAYTSLFMPTKTDTQVVATNPLPSVVVTHRQSPTFTLSSGPDVVIRSEPVLYKINASVIHQSDVINNVPKPLNLNPVYVKVFKTGQSIGPAIEPLMQQTFKNKYLPQSSY